MEFCLFSLFAFFLIDFIPMNFHAFQARNDIGGGRLRGTTGIEEIKDIQVTHEEHLNSN